MVLDAGEIVLRPYEDRDRTSLLAILGRADLLNLALRERPFGVREAEIFIRDNFQVTERLHYGTVSLKSGEAIGFSGFRACAYLNENDVEFGWVLASTRLLSTSCETRCICASKVRWSRGKAFAGRCIRRHPDGVADINARATCHLRCRWHVVRHVQC